METLSNNLKFLRKEKKLTQSELANQLGIVPNAYQKYEYGTREPNLSTVKKIANFFNVSTDFLLGNDDYVSEHKEGYLVEVSEKTEIRGSCGLINNLKKVIVSSDKLAELLNKESGYTIWSAQLIDIAEYKKINDKAEQWN